MKIILILVLLQVSLACSYDSNLEQKILTPEPLEDLFERDLIAAIKSNDTHTLEQVLNYDTHSFNNKYPQNSWGNVNSNEALKELKNKAFHILVKWSRNLNMDEMEEILQIFLNNNLDIEFVTQPCFYPYEEMSNWSEITPLMYAVVVDSRLIKLLVDYGADINKENENHENEYLLRVLSIDRPLSLKALLKIGVNPYIGNDKLNQLGNNESVRIYTEYLERYRLYVQILMSKKTIEDAAELISKFAVTPIVCTKQEDHEEN